MAQYKVQSVDFMNPDMVLRTVSWNCALFIYELHNDAINRTENATSNNNRMAVNNKLERT
jgi:hypothetical protein